jgi:hypothetical protein
LRKVGFEELIFGEFHPPITRYTLTEPKGFELEFITDRPGGQVNRTGDVDATASIAGVTAQKLSYVSLLLREPWTVQVRVADGYPMEVPERGVRIPNPAGYVVQKLLVFKKRDASKRAKDVLYIHDTLDLFGQ